jgi:hypothetical protein
MISVVMGVRELGIHIGWQYIHINGIWQVPIIFIVEACAKEGNSLLRTLSARFGVFSFRLNSSAV